MLFEIIFGFLGLAWAYSLEKDARSDLTPEDLEILDANVSSIMKLVWTTAFAGILLMTLHYGAMQLHFTHIGLVFAYTMLCSLQTILIYQNLQKISFPSFYVNAFLFNHLLMILSMALLLWAIPLHDFFGIPVSNELYSGASS